MSFSSTTLTTAVILSLVLGYSIGNYRGTRSGVEALFTKWKAEMRAKINADPLFPPAPEMLTVLSGTVEFIGPNVLHLKADPVSHNPFDPPSPGKRIVGLNAQTSFFRTQYKTPQELEEDRRKAEELARESARLGMAPSAVDPTGVVRVPLKLTDIAAGDLVSVAAAINIKTAEQFTATSVELRKKGRES